MSIKLILLIIKISRSYVKSANYDIDDLPRTVIPSGIPDWENAPGLDGKDGSVPLKDIEEHVQKLHADSDIGFSKEYEEIQRYCVHDLQVTHDHCSHPDNKCKNRYLNIVACKSTKEWGVLLINILTFSVHYR